MRPDDSTVLLHLANALAEAGDTEESDALMTHFREMRPGGRPRKVQGVVDYLAMTPEQQRELYRTRLEKAVHDHPDDVNSRILYVKLLLSENRLPDAVSAADQLAALKPAATALAETGHALLLANQYGAAEKMLAQAEAADPLSATRLDLATAAFHAAGAGAAAAREGLNRLEQIPATERNASYYVARAQMLDATGKTDEALASMNRALEGAPGDADLYWQAAALMTKSHRTEEALRVLDDAAKALPRESQIPVSRALVLLLAGRPDEAQRVLTEAQHRWPEAPAVWMAEGMIYDREGKPELAGKARKTAAALGAHTPGTDAPAGASGIQDPGALFYALPPREW